MGAPPVFDDAFRSRLAELFAWRRDVRRFTARPLPAGALEALVRGAAAAPSVGFSQPWRFVEVASPARRRAVVAEFERANARAAAAYDDAASASYRTLKLAGLREAAAHLAVFCDEATPVGRGLGRASMPEMLAYSVVLAVHTLWLSARANGIGVGWVSILDPLRVATLLDVEPSWSLVAYLCVGYPAEEHVEREIARAGWERERDDGARLHRR